MQAKISSIMHLPRVRLRKGVNIEKGALEYSQCVRACVDLPWMFGLLSLCCNVNSGGGVFYKK